MSTERTDDHDHPAGGGTAVDPEPGDPRADPAGRVRVGGVAELPRVLQLVQDAYRGAPSRAGWTTEADLLEGGRADADMVRPLLVSLHDVVLLRGERGNPDACCHVHHHRGRASFGLFAVRPALQGRGAGGALLRAAERHAVRRWSVDDLHLSVIAQRTELIAWYERRGYERTGESEPFPYGDERYGRPLREDLELVVLRRALG